jgi:hypothetical protein
MDERLEKALDFSNFRMILSTRQENLKLLMKNKLMLPYEGGLFKVDKELISFVGVLLTAGETNFIFIDKNDIPIGITDLEDFYQKIIEKYRTVLRQYLRNYQTLSEARDIKKVINWNEES